MQLQLIAPGEADHRRRQNGQKKSEEKQSAPARLAAGSSLYHACRQKGRRGEAKRQRW